jgi:tRNA-dihydrouridine synthase B
VVLVSTRSEFYAVLDHYRVWRTQFLDESGELRPRFQPAPMVASFMAEPGQRTNIPVPSGPVEVW